MNTIFTPSGMNLILNSLRGWVQLKIPTPHLDPFLKSSTGGVWTLNGAAQCVFRLEILTSLLMTNVRSNGKQKTELKTEKTKLKKILIWSLLENETYIHTPLHTYTLLPTHPTHTSI